MLSSLLLKLQQLDLPLLLSTMTVDVFSVAEAGAHFDLPLRFLILTFHKLNTQNNTHKET
jgi:hypothetical protein